VYSSYDVSSRLSFQLTNLKNYFDSNFIFYTFPAKNYWHKYFLSVSRKEITKIIEKITLSAF